MWYFFYKQSCQKDNYKNLRRNTMEKTIQQFLEFRKQFTPRQWYEINQIIETQFKK
ncbi:primase-like DNA-binding domain-containing protein, partial [Staphylococcus agnetis]|uniref:primase-like DNA-binding domain-containing protein n=1 Tax=Staphylococcus agnetis TaxID=985762 RepID=UPI000D444ABC